MEGTPASSGELSYEFEYLPRLHHCFISQKSFLPEDFSAFIYLEH